MEVDEKVCCRKVVEGRRREEEGEVCRQEDITLLITIGAPGEV
jgi:hypothetical protein